MAIVVMFSVTGLDPLSTYMSMSIHSSQPQHCHCAFNWLKPPSTLRSNSQSLILYLAPKVTVELRSSFYSEIAKNSNVDDQ